MINAIMFDLDGTLVQSEKLKARSYAIAVQRLRQLPVPDDRAIEAYREIVGAARDVASRPTPSISGAWRTRLAAARPWPRCPTAKRLYMFCSRWTWSNIWMWS